MRSLALVLIAAAFAAPATAQRAMTAEDIMFRDCVMHVARNDPSLTSRDRGQSALRLMDRCEREETWLRQACLSRPGETQRSCGTNALIAAQAVLQLLGR